jgi:hypothetical protein
MAWGCGKREKLTSRQKSGDKPLPLKQRTSSAADRRDFSHNTYFSLLVLLKIREFFITVDNFSIWRRHLAWAFEDGDLRTYMTQRYSSNMVFMSLLLSTELGVLFNSAQVTTHVRDDLVNSRHGTVSFWAGLLIIISALSTILSLISTFTAWSMVSSINDVNAHCILRSSIGQYAAELPGRLIVFSVYSFMVSFMLFFFLLLPVGFWSVMLLVGSVLLFLHIVSVFSGFGRIIMHAGAMGKTRIFSPEFEEFLMPESLHINLLNKARCNLSHNTSIIRQYRRKQQPINMSLDEELLWEHLNNNENGVDISRNHNDSHLDETPNGRSRADSIVRFADEELGMAKPVFGRSPSYSNRPPGSGGGGSFRRGLSSMQHHRNLTPMSALSEMSGSHRSTYSEITLDQDTPRSTSATTSSRKQCDPIDRPPPIPPKAALSSVRSVSNASLEQWLQGASSKGHTSVKSNDTHHQQAGSNELKDSMTATSDETVPLLSLVSPPNEVITDLSDSENAYTQIRRIADGRLPSLSPTRSKRNLSEEERFTLDYGDIGSNDELGIDDSTFREYRYFFDGGHDQNCKDTNQNNQERDEQTRLLDEGQNTNNFYCHDQTPLSTPSVPPQETSKRGNSAPF